ncbi:ABC transporter ATP-binding protein [Neobacillus sp. YIM B06451]|uniref:ABC transporter ATP-binding protein n=1 Tax=Neobacillus sp. YIM B06451 TaxID=3070994 RepID=UPI0029316DE6|nr:ABC transporter ATP-binding protein [Neobacillus sp. YIM B06451]
MLKVLTRPFLYPKPVLKAKGAPEPRKKAKAKNWAGTIRRLWDYLSVKKGGITVVLFLVILSTGLSLLGPILIGRTVDDYIVTKETTGLPLLLAGILGVYILFSLSNFLQGYLMIGIAQDTVSRLRTDLFSHLHRLPISFFDKRQSGELMSRVTNDIENVSSTLNSSVIQIFSSVLMLVGTISVMVWLSPLLTLISLTIVPLMFLGMKWITNRTGILFKEQQRNLGEINGYIEETISGQRIVKTFSQEQKAIEAFLEKNRRLRQAGFWAQTFSGFIPKLMNVLNNVSFTIIAAIGGIFALNGMITIGVIIVFAEYSRQFTRPLNDLANQFNTLLSAVAGAERVFEILDEDAESINESGAIELEEVKGEVEFRNVSFSYEKEGNTIRDVSFLVHPGEMVALVGPTGAGKSTIINLLSRFYDPDSGAILIDGHDTSAVKRKSLRSHMGFVLQDSFLFEGPILENIRYGRLDATDEEVVEAAKMANANSFIEKMPEGYNTVLKQDGSGISQGQKQLLSIARAILADPSILILDEATSSIDTITELKIQDALGRLMEGRTSFVIAHRLNTIRNADKILVLQNGEIIEEGNHDSLLRNKGFYYELNNNRN